MLMLNNIIIKLMLLKSEINEAEMLVDWLPTPQSTESQFTAFTLLATSNLYFIYIYIYIYIYICVCVCVCVCVFICLRPIFL
jgi:hypothetical protein